MKAVKRIQQIVAITGLLFLVSCEWFAEQEKAGRKIRGYPGSGENVYLLAVNVSGSSSLMYRTKTGQLPVSESSSKVLVSAPVHGNSQYVQSSNCSYSNFLPYVGYTASIGLLSPTRGVKADTESYDHVYDYYTGATVEVKKVAAGEHAYFFCQKDKVHLVTDDQWRQLADLFDCHYSAMISVFGSPADSDNNEKVVITYFDMIGIMGEDYKDTTGFFFPGDLYDSIWDSWGEELTGNKMDVINMNLLWNYDENSEIQICEDIMKNTIVHEFQHLINESQRQFTGKTSMETWINEGLAQAAERLCFGHESLAYRVDSFNKDEDCAIRDGLSLTCWGLSVLNYSLSDLFIQYIRLQSGIDVEIYKKIIDHQYGDYRAIESVVISANGSFSSYRDIIRGFYTANLLQNQNGVFSYSAEQKDFRITVRSPSQQLDFIDPSSAIYLKSDIQTLKSTLTLGKEGKNMNYVLVVDGDVYYIENDSWVLQQSDDRQYSNQNKWI